MSLLKRGSVSPEVRELQLNLNQIQKPIPPLAIDGIFGPKTEAAVRVFQKDAKLDADGIVGPKTQEAIQLRLNPTPSVSLSYMFPGFIHIEQDMKNSCWFASAQMLIQWKRERTQRTDSRHPAPSDSEKWSKVYSDNHGISNAHYHHRRYSRSSKQYGCVGFGPCEKSGSWRSLADCYVLDGHSGRDTSDEVTAVFLRLP